MKNKNTKVKLLNEYATRDKLDLYKNFYTTLPDPDKILSENGYDYGVLRDLTSDPHLQATIQQRKMQVVQMGWELEYAKDEKIKNDVMSVIREMPLAYIISEILDAVFYGYSVIEINWEIYKNKVIPVSLSGKPQEWFIFTRDNELRLRKNKNGSFIFEPGEELPQYKFLLTQYKPTYINPYGTKVLSSCFWPVTLKRAAVEGWQLMTERYGMPYLIGRYKTGATNAEVLELLDKLEDMIGSGVAAFEEGKIIEIKERPQYSVGGLYDKIVDFHNKEISKAVLTVTLTTEITKTGSYKATEIHKEMLNYLGVSDKKLVERTLNQLLRYYTMLNYGNDFNDHPRIKLTKKEKVIEESADRDSILKNMGVRFTKEYFKKRYNLSEEDFELKDNSE